LSGRPVSTAASVGVNRVSCGCMALPYKCSPYREYIILATKARQAGTVENHGINL
jgi:hypothetical protein